MSLTFLMKITTQFLFLIAGDCVNLDLGMESGSIPDIKITASSEKNVNAAAKNGRLNSGSSWCAGTSDRNPYLQIDLQTLHIICAVSTQGNSQADQWVKNYTLQSSLDGSTWIDYTETGQVKVMCEMNHYIFVHKEMIQNFLQLHVIIYVCRQYVHGSATKFKYYCCVTIIILTFVFL